MRKSGAPQAEERRLELTRYEAESENTNRRFEDAESEITSLKADVENWRNQADANSAESIKLRADLSAASKQLAERADIEKVLGDQFKVMANEAISSNNDAFVKAADEKIGAMVKPLSDELKRIEEARNKSQGSLTQQISSLVENNTNLANETRSLTTALKRPEVRGSWGEIQLERVAELAGLVKDRDYRLQVSVATEGGGSERPDMVVDMPNGRNIVVDAKAPMRAYLDAVDSDNDSERDELIERHAQQVRERARGLAQKSYQQKFNSPDFVVMFLPGEVFLQPALEKDPELLDWAMQQKVVIATPNTLLALLKTVAMGWREVQLAEEARRIGSLGQELHDRLETFAGHMVSTRTALNRTVESFNRGVGSLERNVLVSARRFKDMGISSTKEIPELDEITTQPREFRSASLRSLPEPDAAGDD